MVYDIKDGAKYVDQGDGGSLNRTWHLYLHHLSTMSHIQPVDILFIFLLLTLYTCCRLNCYSRLAHRRTSCWSLRKLENCSINQRR